VAVEVRLLGPLQVVGDDGGVVAVNGSRLRALLARLALDAGRVVPADVLLEDLYGEEQPGSPDNALQGLVSKLRRALGHPEAIVHRGGGYALELEPGSVDLVTFERLAAEGRSSHGDGDSARAVSRFDDALSLWRGPALMDFAYDEFAQPTIARMVESRAGMLEDRSEALLALGRHHELVSELEPLVSEYPLRERLRTQLMLALYRSGRQAEALRQFQEARRVLGEELGLEPGPELRRLEAAMLVHDPALEAPNAPAAEVRAPPERRTNLRAPLTATIGREHDLADLRDLVGTHRLVTVVGPGGAGKTRLATEAARSLVDGFGAGVWLVELAPLADPGAIAPAIAAALGIPDLPGVVFAGDQALGRVADFLAEGQRLLVVDNCEHLVDGAARVVEALLASCPDLKVLATSRERLGVPGEKLWPARPLALDDAVELFAERASEVAPAFALTEGTRPLVAEVCARLDGLPLALELAAARARALPLADIAARLDERFRLLTGGPRTGEVRQQTLRAVVDWSYELLFDDERRLFERLSVFAGGCDLAASEAVCADELLPASDVADVVARLVDKSMVVVGGRRAVGRAGPHDRGWPRVVLVAERQRRRGAALAGHGHGLPGRPGPQDGRPHDVLGARPRVRRRPARVARARRRSAGDVRALRRPCRPGHRMHDPRARLPGARSGRAHGRGHQPGAGVVGDPRGRLPVRARCGGVLRRLPRPYAR
jgi:predicted ATPase/DNA-binding SARP family transcriptional activator